MPAHVMNGNVPVVARILRYKQWKSTQKYVHIIEFKDEDYEGTVATLPEEIRALGMGSWTKYDEMSFQASRCIFTENLSGSEV